MKRVLLLSLLVGLLSPAHGQEAAAMVDVPVPQLRAPSAGVLTGGQPEPAAWRALAAHGVTTVINLRPDAELAGRDEAAEVAAAGLAYHQLPVDGMAGLSLEKARALRTLLREATGPVLVHCASGNRVGALIGLAAADDGASLDEAIASGRAAGMTSAEGRLRELLGELPAKP